MRDSTSAARTNVAGSARAAASLGRDFTAQADDTIRVTAVRLFHDEAAGGAGWPWVRLAPPGPGQCAAIIVAFALFGALAIQPVFCDPHLPGSLVPSEYTHSL
jgi:hypothetical protein